MSGRANRKRKGTDRSQLVVSYSSEIEQDFFSEFVERADEEQIPVVLEPRATGPTMGLEWVLPTTVFVVLAKPFIDDFMKRAAKDTNDLVYPKLKKSVAEDRATPFL